ncbi:MAG TPA: dipeptidase [Bacteroidales bacterium]|nr:dipeptidase [Bacteroidales bacterium]
MKKILFLPVVLFFLSSCSSPEEQLIKKADRIHSSILTVDTHCDTPMSFEESDFDLGVRHDEGCVDFPRMKEGGLHSEFFAVFIGQGPRDDSTFEKVHTKALNIFSAIHANVEKNSNVAEIALTSSDAYRIRKNGKIAAFIGLENGYPIGKNLARVKEFYDLGARYITLSHTKNNDICDSSTDPAGPEHNGLSPLGEQVVKEMNRLGMMIDVSHISDESFYDVLKLTNSPVIASHSSCRALCGSPRNLTDDMLLALKDNDGVIQICILSNYLKTPDPNPELDARLKEIRDRYGDFNSLSADSQKLMRTEYRTVQQKYQKLASVKDIADHIDHAVQVIGIDHVGIGTDFDGGGGVDGCKTVAEMKNITIELLHRGYTKADIEKIWGGNVMRVMRKVEEISGTV